MAASGNLDQRRVGEWNAHEFALATIVVAATGRTAVEALRWQAGATHGAGAVAEDEGRHDEVAHVEGCDVRAHLFHDADQLVADRAHGMGRRPR